MWSPQYERATLTKKVREQNTWGGLGVSVLSPLAWVAPTYALSSTLVPHKCFPKNMLAKWRYSWATLRFSGMTNTRQHSATGAPCVSPKKSRTSSCNLTSDKDLFQPGDFITSLRKMVVFINLVLTGSKNLSIWQLPIKAVQGLWMSSLRRWPYMYLRLREIWFITIYDAPVGTGRQHDPLQNPPKQNKRRKTIDVSVRLAFRGFVSLSWHQEGNLETICENSLEDHELFSWNLATAVLSLPLPATVIDSERDVNLYT